jgi:DnaJ-domain-containing protein 1
MAMAQRIPDLYAILGVPPNATAQEIAQAYRRRVCVLHPDRFDPETEVREWRIANEMMAQLNQAYAVLRDPQSRAAYSSATSAEQVKRPDAKPSQGDRRKWEQFLHDPQVIKTFAGVLILLLVGFILFTSPGSKAHRHRYPKPEVTLPLNKDKFSFQESFPELTVRTELQPLDHSVEPSVPIEPALFEQELPQNGDVTRYDSRACVAPLEIVTRGPHTHYFLKICDWHSDAPIATIFIRGGESCETMMPLGTYRIKYATGSKWYGPEYLFGAKTTYQRAEAQFEFKRDARGVTGYTVELFAHVNGNLQSATISPKDW